MEVLGMFKNIFCIESFNHVPALRKKIFSSAKVKFFLL